MYIKHDNQNCSSNEFTAIYQVSDRLSNPGHVTLPQTDYNLYSIANGVGMQILCACKYISISRKVWHLSGCIVDITVEHYGISAGFTIYTQRWSLLVSHRSSYITKSLRLPTLCLCVRQFELVIPDFHYIAWKRIKTFDMSTTSVTSQVSMSRSSPPTPELPPFQPL
jgi:hypothetical protein